MRLSSLFLGLGLPLRPSGPSYGPELVTPNNSFDDGLTGWSGASTAPATITVSGGTATYVVTGGTARMRRSVTTEAGATYIIDAGGTLVSGSGLFFGTSAGTTDILNGAAVAAGTRTFVSPGTTVWINTATSTNGLTLEFVSLRKIL